LALSRGHLLEARAARRKDHHTAEQRDRQPLPEWPPGREPRNIAGHGASFPPAIYASFRSAFSIERNQPLLRRVLREHVSDDAREMLAKRVLEHLQFWGFEIDEDGQALWRKPPRTAHRTP
jgi:hypothetical protein